jgi:hypothetical protein
MSFTFPPPPGPQTCKYHSRLINDTLPDKNITINIDIAKIMNEVKVAIEKIDFEKIGREVEQSLKKIDWDKINAEINVSIKKIDWDKLNKEIEESIEKSCDPEKKKEIQKELNQMKQKLNSKEVKESLEKMKAMNMKEGQNGLRNTKIELEKTMKKLQKELQESENERLKRDAALNSPVLKDNILILI